MSNKPIYIDWVPKDALDGVMHLDPMEELAYRRILDMIYAADDTLEDNDESLKWSTKTGNKWPKIKKRLVELKKIEVIDGRISNKVCREKLEAARGRIEAGRTGGLASAEKRKSLKNKETASTTVGETVATTVPTNKATVRATNSQPIINHQYTDTSYLADFDKSAPVDKSKMKKIIFGEILNNLSETSGRDKKSLRPMVGKWCSTLGDHGVLDAFLKAEKFAPADPVGYIQKMVKTKKANEPPPPLSEEEKLLIRAKSVKWHKVRGLTTTHVGHQDFDWLERYEKQHGEVEP